MFEFLKRNQKPDNTEFRSYLNTIVTTYDNYIQAILSGTGINFSDAYFDNISTVNICVGILADTTSTMPVGIYKKDAEGNRIYQTSDYRNKLLNGYPLPYMDSFTVRHFWETQRGYRGNSFSIIERGSNNKPISLIPVFSSQVKGYELRDGKLQYNIDYNGRLQYFDFMNVLHFRKGTVGNSLLSTVDIPGFWGKTPVEALRLNLSLSYKAIKTIDSIYENETKATKFFKQEILNMNADAIEEWKKKITDENAGFEKAGKEGFIMPAGISMQESPVTVNDALFLNTVTFNAKQIGSWYGVPPYKLGFDDARNTGKSIETLGLEFKTDAIDPILQMYKKELEFKLLTDYEIEGGFSVEFDTKKMIALDHKTRSEIQERYVKMGVLSPNQVCLEEGYPTFEGGDKRLVFNQNTDISNIDSNKNSL
jgi:HK97 family phage portal protein